MRYVENDMMTDLAYASFALTFPTDQSLKQILQVTDRSAPASKIKSSYYKAALKLHPDRVSDEKKEEVRKRTDVKARDIWSSKRLSKKTR